MNFTFNDLTLAAGAGAVASMAVLITQIIKAVAPGVFDKITGATVAFVVVGITYVIGAIVLALIGTWPTFELLANGLLFLFLASLVADVAALGLHNVVNNGAATFVKGAPTDSSQPPA